MAVPSDEPSTSTSIFATPTSSKAHPPTTTVPLTVALAEGTSVAPSGAEMSTSFTVWCSW